MPILTEQERLINQEQNLINDNASYALTGTWATVKDEGNITLAAESLLLIMIKLKNSGGGVPNVRVKVGSQIAFTATWGTADSADHNIGTIISVAAGTYKILVEGKTAGTGYVDGIFVGVIAFNDVQQSDLGAYSSGIAETVAARITPVGALLNTTYFVQISATTPSALTTLENVGDNLTNGVSISVDGAQVNWDEKMADDAGYHGTSGKIARSLTVGSSHTITISKRNANTVVTISVVACPWILPTTSSQVLTFNFSQGSTFYCSLEPLFTDPTKTVAVGAVRGIDFGSASDYYSTQSGTGLIQYSFTMDVVDISINAVFGGLGGCIGYIAADVR